MSVVTHILAAMAGGLVAIGGYAVVKVGAEQERRFERMREIERMLMEYGNLVAERRYNTRLDAHRYAERILEVE